jgi:hypothetical protein
VQKAGEQLEFIEVSRQPLEKRQSKPLVKSAPDEERQKPESVEN